MIGEFRIWQQDPNELLRIIPSRDAKAAALAIKIAKSYEAIGIPISLEDAHYENDPGRQTTPEEIADIYIPPTHTYTIKKTHNGETVYTGDIFGALEFLDERIPAIFLQTETPSQATRWTLRNVCIYVDDDRRYPMASDAFYLKYCRFNRHPRRRI